MNLKQRVMPSANENNTYIHTYRQYISDAQIKHREWEIVIFVKINMLDLS